VAKYFTQKTYRNELVIFFAWLIMQSVLIWKNGIVTAGESEKYISQAKLLVTQGHLSSASYIMYLTQILSIAVVKKLGLGFFAVVTIQMFLNLIATIQYFRFARELFASATLALASSLTLILNYPLQEFNTFLQTESLFYSFGIITTCFVLKQQSFNLKKFTIVVLLLLLLSITRPTGILFMPPVFLYIFFRFLPSLSFNRKLLLTGIGTIIFIFILNAALGSGGELDFMLPYRDEQIICGLPTLPGFVKITEASNPNSVFGLLYYVFHNFGQFSRLAWLRSCAFFGLTRSYYSTFHNTYLVVYFYTIFLFVIMSLRFWLKKHPHIFFYFLSLTLMYWGSVMLSCDDWHNRFFLTLSPYLILLSLPAVSRLFTTRASKGF